MTRKETLSLVRAWLQSVSLLLLFAGCAAGAWADGRHLRPVGCDPVKNIIVMVPDGCSQTVQTLARWYTGQPVTLDAMVSGMVMTHEANSVITDSASAMTACATGHKTTNGFLAVGPRTDGLLTGFTPTLAPYVPAATVLEGAKMRDKAVGLVATSRITHATPAAFAAHIHNRDLDNEIMEHMVYQDIDVVFGGGKRHLLPTSEGGKRTDGENLLEVLQDRGYQWVEGKDQLAGLTSGKAWGLFASSHMEADIDRPEFAPEQPSLAEMTSKAIELLSQNRRGFFLMVEGSQVDWADHAMDPVYSLTDFLAFDDAVKVAVEFAENDGDTLVLVFPDHNTGGFSIGNRSTDSRYTGMSLETVIDPLMGMRITSTGLDRKIGKARDIDNIAAQIKLWWGIDPTDEDMAEIMALIADVPSSESISYPLSEVISKNHTIFGWTTHGHTGEDVPLWSFGPNRPIGLLDNTDLAKMIACRSRFDLDRISERLFVDVSEAFSAEEVTVDTTDPANPVLVIKGARLPVSKDLVIKNGRTYNLEGVVVHAPEIGKYYIPKQAVNLVNYAM